jgi:hypothetical protein
MKTKKIFIYALAITAFAACRRGNDLYTSPNSPSVASPSTMLVGIEANTFMNYEGGLARIASIMIQHNSGVSAQYSATDVYDLNSSDMDNYWGGAGGGGLYTGSMVNARAMYSTYEAANPYYGGIAKILMAMNLGMATQMWGDVPYKEAFQLASGINAPHFDPQVQILTDIQALLDQGIADLNQPATANAFSPGADDLIFGGNTAAWLKTAYVLKARYHMMMTNHDGSAMGTTTATQVLVDLSNGMTSNADDCKSSHNGTQQNQWDAFQLSRAQNVLACQVLIDSLTQADPRTWMYFDTTGEGNMAVGNTLGSQNVGASQWGPYFISASGSNPTPLVTYAEAQFLAAEANIRLGNAAAANTALKNGIMASISDVTSGASTGTVQANVYTVINTTLHTIMLEKWKAMFGQPIEAYTDFRRTGYPALKPNPSGIRNWIPYDMPTSLGEQTNNPNAPPTDYSRKPWFM